MISTLEILSAEQRHIIESSGPPELWTDEGLKVLGRLMKESRERLGLTQPQMLAYIELMTEARGLNFAPSKGTLSRMESARVMPSHNMVVSIAAALYLREPVTQRILTEREILLTASGLYDPYGKRVSSPLLCGDKLRHTEESDAMSTVTSNKASNGRKGLARFAITIKAARLQRGVSQAFTVAQIQNASGIEIQIDELNALETGQVNVISSGIVMAIVAAEYVINPLTGKPYSVREILSILHEELEPINPETREPFSESDFQRLGIEYRS